MTTTETRPAPDEQGSMTGTVEGADTPAATTEERTFTQAQVNDIVKARLAEERTKLTSKHEKELETKLAATAAERDKALEATVADRVKAALAERDLADTKRSLQAEYGLSDAQLARLSGETGDDLKADAETLFGALKQRKPPVLHAGGDPATDAPLDTSQMEAAEIRERKQELWRNRHRS
jgi:hypothetical protein